MKILYVNAMISPSVGEIFRQGVAHGLGLSQRARTGQALELRSINFFTHEKSSPRYMGEFAREWGADAVILSGSEKNISDREDRWVEQYLLGLKDLLQVPEQEPIENWMGPTLPVLGICFGHQALAAALGGEVARFKSCIDLRSVQALTQGLNHPMFKRVFAQTNSRELKVLVTHSDQVIRIPRGFHLLLSSDYCQVQAMAHDRWPIVSLQSHPEASVALKPDVSEGRDWQHLSDEDMNSHQGPRILSEFINWIAR